MYRLFACDSPAKALFKFSADLLIRGRRQSVLLERSNINFTEFSSGRNSIILFEGSWKNYKTIFEN
jgi:hypothetical protein